MIIDLSLPIKNNTPEPDSPRINYLDHKKGALHLAEGAKPLAQKIGIENLNMTEEDFPDSMGLANEEISLDTHSGTHLDAPWHFGPKSGNKKSLCIDEIPLEWCFNDGVVLDFSYKQPGDLITESDIEKALEKIDYHIKPLDIVLIRTDAYKHFYRDDYFSIHPGMSPKATELILNKGVKIIGIDAWGFDRPAVLMLKDYLNTKNKNFLFPSHFAGRKKEYCHIEKLANLDRIPKPYGFKVSCFPVKIEKASAGWCRVVAII
ncbi:MAG: cyclase family protein [Elusimicrobiota bacterium]